MSSDFDDHLRRELMEWGLDFNARVSVGVAVSGGADSMALLTSLCHVLPANITLKAITIDHNMRSEEESGGDAQAVKDYCRKIGVPCACHVIPRGKVDELAKERHSGAEEAARTLRYQAFDTFIECNNLVCLCLAHHKNDQIETVLMRLFAGGDTNALSGIPKKRGKYFRPLLDVERKDIESYLLNLGIEWRTDRSNSENTMLRNRVRNLLWPMLDANFPGWQDGVWSMSRKMKDNNTVLESCTDLAFDRVDAAFDEKDRVYSLMRFAFSRESRAVQRRLIYRGIKMVGAQSRVPSTIVENILDDAAGKAEWKENASGIEFECGSERIILRKHVKEATESGFFVIIEKDGLYALGSRKLRVRHIDGGMQLTLNEDESSVIFLLNLCFPFVCRSRQSGDSIRTGDGSLKAVSRIFEDWKCGPHRDEIAIIQDLNAPDQPLVCLWGQPFGYKNWIVKE
ncbi:MAG: tRNA lysidine(34) synthetase TilS [Treponema sp.]|nr:tRNA lysidine(34) synthetase TilS [Treponema sp.]